MAVSRIDKYIYTAPTIKARNDIGIHRPTMTYRDLLIVDSIPFTTYFKELLLR